MSVLSVPRQFAGLLLWLLLTLVAAALGAWASIEAGSFYLQLERPAWAPPGSVFSPVWTTLFVLMAIAAWLVWRTNGVAGARVALSLYFVQLVFNVLWSWLFFGWHLGGWAFAEVLLLWGLILATLVAFWHTSHLAGVLLVPYLLWVGFAVILNYTVWQLNPALL
ncbi:TspO/MBR family protein [Thiohalophilus thiocyanatoxydans]|uniref:TspO/MBR related protein n=1 Tax=Thiohalophilus thiocyanatoxydans TaxID=381308 RepID=A0A4V3H4R1_9GAMM|nr:TspO/MBR family protein [Thiohalophilus thiocyanatoxydans]TDY04155.1 TspO/MBR related protein [Thiohalophilus thiocyanatoxydans]